MNSSNWFTTAITGILAAAPQFLGIIPHPWNGVATAAIAFAGAVYHLFQESPQS